jgi:RNAse (barnase) inhibitor barstar
MKIFASIQVLITSCLLLSSCSRAKEEKQSMTIGMDEDYQIKTYYDGPGWGNMSKSMVTVGGSDEDGPVKLTFLADHDYSLMSTQHHSIWIAGTYKPLDTNWDYFSWNLRVSTKMPIELVFSGFQNTNGYKTNEDGTVFDCMVGETNVVFTGQLVLVYNRQTNKWHK